jgi:hypothetical protein
MEGPADPQVGAATQADREGTAYLTIVSGGQKGDAGEAGQDDRPGKEDIEGSRVGLGGASSSGAHEGRPLQLRGGAPDGDETEDEGEDLPGGNGALLGSLAQQYATDSEDGEGDDDEDEDEDDGADHGGEEEEEAGEGAAAGDPGLNTFELAILAPEDRRYLCPLEQAKVDNLLACLDSTVLIELAKGVMLQLNITQTALAHMAQVSQSILSYWLAGRLRPSQENINVKMRAFLRSYCVATEVAPTDGDEDEAGTYSVAGALPFYDVEGFYAHPGYALEEAEPEGMAGVYGANGGAGGRAEEASSEGSELLHHLAARTAATTGRALHSAPAPAGPWPGGEAGGAESKEDEDRRQRGLAEQASTSTAAAGWEESYRGGGEQLGIGPAAVRGGSARKASRSQRKRGGATGVGGGGVGRSGGEQAGSLVQNGGDAGGLEKAGGPAASRMAQERSKGEQNGGEEVGRGADPMSAPGTGPALPPASTPPPEVAPAAAVRGRAREEAPAAAALDTERGSKSRVRGAARASAARAAASAATAAAGAAAQSGQKGGGQAAGQKRAPAPKSTGPEEVHSYTLALPPGEQMGGLDGKPHETDAQVLLKGAGEGATAPGKKLASSRGGQQHKVRSRKWRSPHVRCNDGS